MGLNINSINEYGQIAKYDRVGSYSTLHVLRNWIFTEILKKEESDLTNVYYDGDYGDFEAILDHSDCDGGYISFGKFGITGTNNSSEWADLDKLRKELDILSGLREKMPNEVKEVFDHFESIINKRYKLADIVYFT